VGGGRMVLAGVAPLRGVARTHCYVARVVRVGRLRVDELNNKCFVLNQWSKMEAVLSAYAWSWTKATMENSK